MVSARWSTRSQSRHRFGSCAASPRSISSSRTSSALCPDCSDKNGVTIDPPQPVVGSNLTVTVKGHLLKRVTDGKIDVDLRLMKFIKLTPKFDLCEQLEGDLFQESNVSCPLEVGPVTLIAKKFIPDDVPKVNVFGNITLTNQDGDVLTCTLFLCETDVGVHIDVTLQSKDGTNKWGIW
jgi:ML domain